MTKDTTSTIEHVRKLDSIQRDIWARINDEVNLRGIKLSIGDAYALGSVIKEVLHPEVSAYIETQVQEARIDELQSLLEGDNTLAGSLLKPQDHPDDVRVAAWC